MLQYHEKKLKAENERPFSVVIMIMGRTFVRWTQWKLRKCNDIEIVYVLA